MRQTARELIILVITFVAFLYLMSPSLLPDFVPLIGWLDEGIATTILLSAFKHWGIDLTGLFSDEDEEQPKQVQQASQSGDVVIEAHDAPQQARRRTRKIRIPRAVLEELLQKDYVTSYTPPPQSDQRQQQLQSPYKNEGN